jgi:hypothetical protein
MGGVSLDGIYDVRSLNAVLAESGEREVAIR